MRSPAGQPQATSRVHAVADGCSILEQYEGLPGPAGQRYIGAGLHVFDPSLNAWRQLFSDNRPAATLMIGKETGGRVVYEWEITNPQGRQIPKRYTLSATPDDPKQSVRQLGERSDDGGKTWTVEFDLRYVRARTAP